MKNLKRFNEGWFSSSKPRKDDDIAEKILKYIENNKSNDQTLTLGGFEFRVNDLSVKVIGNIKHNGWHTNPDDVVRQGLFINDKKLNASKKLIVKIYNAINFIYKKHKQREFEENERELEDQKNQIRRKIN